MLLPSNKEVSNSTPIYPGSNFTWGETTKDCTRYLKDLVIDGKLITTANEIEQSIIETAKELDQVRSLLVKGFMKHWVTAKLSSVLTNLVATAFN